jgi:enoyl-CoA hydratase/carnithine racemase
VAPRHLGRRKLIHFIKENTLMSQNQIAAQRLFLNADKTELVGEGDERAAFLYATVGDEIPAEAAEMFGLVDGALPGFDAAAAAEVEALVRAAEEAAAAEAYAASEAAHQAAKEAADAAAAAEAEAAAKAEAAEAEKAAAEAAAKAEAATKPAAAAETKPKRGETETKDA